MAFGATASFLLPGVDLPRAAGAAFAGAIFAPGMLILLLFWGLVVGGGCID